jgi:hypothetical protein
MGGLTGVPVGFRGGGAPGRVGMSPRTMLPLLVGREGGMPGRDGDAPGLTGAPIGRPMGGLVEVAPDRDGVAPIGGVAGRPIGGLEGGVAGLFAGATGRGAGLLTGTGFGAGVAGFGAAGFGAAGLGVGVAGLRGGGVGFLGPPPLRVVRSGSKPKGRSGCFRWGMIQYSLFRNKKASATAEAILTQIMGVLYGCTCLRIYPGEWFSERFFAALATPRLRFEALRENARCGSE